MGIWVLQELTAAVPGRAARVFVSRFLPLLKRALCAPVQVGTGMFCCARVLCRALWGEFCSFGGAGSDGVLRGGDTDLQLQGVVPNLMEEIGHFWMQEGVLQKCPANTMRALPLLQYSLCIPPAAAL